MADTLDVLTIAEARVAVGLGSTDSSKDGVLVPWVTAVSRQLDRLCGPIVKRTITAEQHPGTYRTPLLEVDYAPIYTTPGITLTEYTSAGDATVLSAEDFDTKPTAGYRLTRRRGIGGGYTSSIERRSSGNESWFDDAVVITYDAGRHADTATVDPLFKQAASMMVRSSWVGEQASGTQTFGEVSGDPTIALLGPKLLNRVAALLDGEIVEAVAVL
jgi:hypothetical protein